jgi:hypothetical protein
VKLGIVHQHGSSHISGDRESDHCACVTGSDRRDVVGPEVTSVTEVRSAHARIIPRFFLTIVVVQNVPLRMTGSSMTTGCDVTGSEGSFRPFFGCFRIFSRFLAIDYVV